MAAQLGISHVDVDWGLVKIALGASVQETAPAKASARPR
jgi:hypothetical protein